MDGMLIPFDFSHPKDRAKYIGIGRHCQSRDTGGAREMAEYMAPYLLACMDVCAYYENTGGIDILSVDGSKAKIKRIDHDRLFFTEMLLQLKLSLFFGSGGLLLDPGLLNTLYFHSNLGKALQDELLGIIDKKNLTNNKEHTENGTD